MITARKAAVMTAVKTIDVIDVPLPDIGPEDVLIRVEAVGVCGSDTHFFTEGHIGDLVVTDPLILGHESAGVIVEVGSNVDRSRIGQRVSIEPQRTCGSCDACKRGEYNLCATVFFFGCPPRDHGAFADLTVVRSDFAYVVPEGMSPEAAALTEPLSVAVAALRKVSMRAGDRVLITGAGPVGLLIAHAARFFGAAEISMSDPHPARRKRAETWGADMVFNTLRDQDPLGVDIFIDASGASAAIEDGIRHCRPGAHIGLVGMGAERLDVPFAAVQHAELVLHGVFRYANTWPTALAIANRSQRELESLVTSRFGLDGVAEALTETNSDPSGLKSIVYPAERGGRLAHAPSLAL